jgi:hypothetical protein
MNMLKLKLGFTLVVEALLSKKVVTGSPFLLVRLAAVSFERTQVKEDPVSNSQVNF